jgi:hypothetical protein
MDDCIFEIQMKFFIKFEGLIRIFLNKKESISFPFDKEAHT